ncbi:recombinase family protein [Pseudonocardia sp. MH-G8]|uniref:recombinase family protein n=1 Tax=Pseudonocardia sp. MH-G8 TaxID=1854588 RepID=UPI0013040393|nr:recombinase family protein [Pseudonocardia sp. MH-G8]
MTPPVHAAIYLRISLDKTGEGLAIERQRDECTALAVRRGWTVAREYVDHSVSAAGKVERPGFRALLDALRAGTISRVVAWDMSRLVRNARDRYELVELCRERGVIISMVRGSDLDPTTAAGRIVISVQGEIAEEEIAVKADRQRSARQQAATNGRPVRFSHRPFGYCADRLTPHPVESAAIADACQLVLSGGSLRSIAQAWNVAELPTPQGGERWLPSVVRGVLLNPRNAGLAVYEPAPQKGERRKLPHEREVVGRGEWKAIITEEVYRAVVDTLTDATRATPKGTRTLLGGLARCPCGEHVYGGKNSRGTSILKCGRLHRGEAADGGHVSRRAEPVTAFVVALVLARLSRADALDLLAPDEDESAQAVEPLRTRARALRTRLAALGEDTELPLPTLRAQVAAARRKLAEVEADLAEAGKASVLAGVVGADDVAATWEALDLDQQRTIVDTLVSVTALPPGKGPRAGVVRDAESGEWVADPATVDTTWKV